MKMSNSIKLNPTAVIDIRLKANRGASVTDLATEYHVSRKTIQSVVNWNSWSHVPEPATLVNYSGYSVTVDGRVMSDTTGKALKSYTRNDGTSYVKVSKTTSNGTRLHDRLTVEDLVNNYFDTYTA